MSRIPLRKTAKFGDGLAEARKARGMTQVQLAEAIGSSQRAISSYESNASYPPAPVLIDMAKVLKVSVDELVGLKPARPLKRIEAPEERRLWRKFRQVLDLPEKDQRAIIRLVNSLVAPAGKA